MLKRSGVYNSRHRGFSLIEVLIAVAVLSFGLLAIGTFQAKLLNESGYSKARAEAIALAQEKLDELRNYSNAHELAGNLRNNPVQYPTKGSEYEYPDNVPTAATVYPAVDAPESISGQNAAFNREWEVSRAGDLSTAVVRVKWQDRAGDWQEVSLETDFSYRNPRGTADVGELKPPLVDSPTGKAYLGDGTLTQEEMDGVKTDGIDNNDGTYTQDHDGDGDLELIVENPDGTGGEVVLTLPDACKLEEGCTDFVHISGTVYFDRTGGSRIDPSKVFVLASDAAYCSRWIPEATQTSTEKLATTTALSTTVIAKSGGDIYRNAKDTTVDFTGSGADDYDYFNYTCYLGGGWYGNIGVVVADANTTRSDFTCVGDPGASDTDAWKHVELARRRVYRGMLHNYTVVSGEHVPVEDGDGNIIYYTRGIMDDVDLPDPNWAARSYGHDFVFSLQNNATKEDCVTALTRPDAVANGGNLFNGVPGDFICLNEDSDDTHPGTMAAWTASPWHYLNPFDITKYDADSTCPYNPSDPPAKRYTITGTLTLDEVSTSIWGSADPKVLEDEFEGNINTTDGYGNCTVSNTGTTSITYSCDYYVWVDEDNNDAQIPWTGKVVVDTPSDLVCQDPSDPTVYTRHAAYPFTDVLNDQTAAFNCRRLEDYIIEGVITVDAGNDLSAIEPVVEADNMSGTGCVVTAGAESATYQCTVLESGYNSGTYTGDVRITLPDGYVCTATGGTVDGTLATFSFLDEPMDLTVPNSGNNVSCNGPNDEIKFTGLVNDGVPSSKVVLETGLSVSSPDGATCTVTGTSGQNVTYECTAVVPDGTGWSGTVNVTPPDGYWCGTDTAVGAVTGTNIANGGTLTDVTCASNPNDAIAITGVITVAYPSDTVWYSDWGADPWASTWDGFSSPNPANDIVTPLNVEMLNTDGTVGGTCALGSSPSLTDGQITDYTYTCKSNSGAATYPQWDGKIRISTVDSVTGVSPLWAYVCGSARDGIAVSVSAGTTVSGINGTVDSSDFCP